MQCPICNGRIKSMYKPDLQYHCRGRCGLIIRVCGADYENKLTEMVIRLTNDVPDTACG